MSQDKEEIFGSILREQRKAKKISQEKLAKLTGLDRTFISLVENGKRNPTFTTILKICSAIGIEPSELFSIYEKKDPGYAPRIHDLRSIVVRGRVRRQVLRALVRPESPTELARALGIDRPAVSRAILVLVQKGLAECLTPREHRSRYYQTTELGKKVIDLIEGN